MKKIMLIGVLILLAACGNVQLTEEQEIFLADFDFMVELIQENYPFMSLVDRRFAQNSMDELANLRESLIRAFGQEEDYLVFYEHMRQGLRAIFHDVGHLTLFPPDFLGVDDPSGVEFVFVHDFREQPIEIPELTFEFPINDSVHTEIIEEGRIALVEMDSFLLPLTSAVNSQLRMFLAQINNYEHIIIDIRNNSGGRVELPAILFIAPNIREPIVLDEFAFITAGELAIHAEEFYRFDDFSMFNDEIFPPSMTLEMRSGFRNTNRLFNAVPARQLVETYNLTGMNEQDLENFEYGFRILTQIQPMSSIFGIAPGPFMNNANIWVLTGSDSTSAADAFAHLAREAGFTLVGEPTGGVVGCGRAYFLLPRTGFVLQMDTFYTTDGVGRAFEEFTVEPHYFSRAGMDALETVLAIIAERGF